MKRNSVFLIALGLVLLAGVLITFNPLRKKESRVKELKENVVQTENSLRDGDIIFHTSQSEQSKAIQLATHSEYSHCGIIYKKGNHFYVYEAVQPVKLAPIYKWIAHGKGGHYVVKRLKNADKVLTPETIGKMKAAGEKYQGKDYDIYFGWTDEKIYCSELVWKIYKEATGLEVGRLQQLKEFDLTDKIVLDKLNERYGKDLPLEDTVISPVSIFNSELLVTVRSH